VRLHVRLPDELADERVGVPHHALPPRLELLLAVQLLPEEGEVLVDEVVGEG
jgi:hypothetical protein